MQINIFDIIHLIPAYSDKINVSRPSIEVLNNTDAVLNTMPLKYKQYVSLDSLSINNLGNITIDWAIKKDFVTIEIAQTHLYYYTELPDGSNPEGLIKFSGVFPEVINNALHKLYETII